MVSIPIAVPRQGEKGDIPDHELSIDALRLCQNMMRSNQGRLITRPGYSLRGTGAQPGVRIMGLRHFRTTAGAERTVAGTTTGWFDMNGASGAWTNITGSALTGSATQQVRFRPFLVSGVYNLIGVNGQDSPKIWNGAAATYSNLGGSPPTAVDIAIANNRALLLVAPDTIRISDVNDPETWPSTLAPRLVDGGDQMVGMEALGRLAVAVYGEKSQWIGRAQVGTYPFRFEMVDAKPGPLAPAAVVPDGSKVHYYLGEDFNVYRFDGVAVTEVGAAMQDFVYRNILYDQRRKTHGTLISALRTIFWWFPYVATGEPTVGIYYDLRNGSMGRLKYATAITASAEWISVPLITWDDLASYTWDNIANTYPTWDSFGGVSQMRQVIGDTGGNIYAVGVGEWSDNGAPIEMDWELPLIPAGGKDKAFIPSSFETFFRKTSQSVTVQPSIGHTDTLMSDRTLASLDNFDLSTDQRNDLNAASVAGSEGKRFVSARHYVSTRYGPVEWLGGVLHGEETDLAMGPTN